MKPRPATLALPMPAPPVPALAIDWGRDARAGPGEPSLRRIAGLSLLTIVAGFGGLLLWAATSTLNSAVPAPGVIVSAAKRKTVSLLDAGILKRLLVAEGDHVATGQALVLLDDVQARAAMDQAAAQYWGGVAQATRLQAEALDQRRLSFPPDLLQAAASDPAIAAEIEAERHLFDARWAAFDGAELVGRRRIAQMDAVATALAAQIREVDLRVSLYDAELRGTEILLAKGYATRVHAMELQRASAELRGQKSDLAGRLAETRQGIAQAELEIIGAAQSRRSDITKDRSGVQTQIADAAGRLRAARDLVDKRVVNAPEDGIVTDLKFFTPGSSIGAGQPILDLVPANSSLLVEASVSPTDIEHVKVGQPINVRLTAYKAHQVPVVSGHLVYVAADRQMDAQNQPVFLARGELDPGALKGLHDVALYAGMPADVLILGGRRTALDYLISPIRDSIRHAMNEE